MHVIVCAAAALLLVCLVEPCRANEVTITDGDTLNVDGTTYRLDAVDAPELDQVCLDEKRAAWRCGLHAGEWLE